jgi:hypothetical protein
VYIIGILCIQLIFTGSCTRYVCSSRQGRLQSKLSPASKHQAAHGPVLQLPPHPNHALSENNGLKIRKHPAFTFDFLLVSKPANR